MKAEKLCREAGLEVEITSIPSHISSECGMALRVTAENKTVVTDVIKEHRFDFDIYEG
ncbi:MAG: DUF3343 domain-containing protein [Bacteroidales bacterium]